MRSDWIGIGAGLVLTGIIGYAAGVITTEDKARKKYEDASASMRRAYEMARHMPEETPSETEEHLVEVAAKNGVALEDDGTMFRRDDAGQISVYDPKDVSYTPAPVNPYHHAVTATETGVEAFVTGEVNAQGISYIEEEEYEEEDGFEKNQISVVVDVGNAGEPALFFMNGVSISDWDVRLGDSILVDLFSHTPPGLDTRILYVRNHRLVEDYEVSLESP